MQHRRSATNTTALLKLLATAARTGIIPAYLGFGPHHGHHWRFHSGGLRNFILLPITMHPENGGFDFVHHLLSVILLLGDIETFLSSETHEWSKPFRLPCKEKRPYLRIHLCAKQKALAPLGSTPLMTFPKNRFESIWSAVEYMHKAVVVPHDERHDLIDVLLAFKFWRVLSIIHGPNPR